MRRYIKFMIGLRSVEKLHRELDRTGIQFTEIDCGIVKFLEKLNVDKSHELNRIVKGIGFEILNPISSDLLDHAAKMINELIYDNSYIAISDYPMLLENKLKCDQFEINRLFSQIHGISVCQYARIYQVERIKEMILYEDLDLREVVEIMHLKDEAMVEQLFKNVTGLSHTHYQRVSNERKIIQQGKNHFRPICVKGINVAN